MAEKGVVLLSGGVDSTVLTTYLHRNGCEIWPLTFYYGQRHAKETQAARAVCDELDLLATLRHFDLGNISELIHSALTGRGGIPDGHYTDEVQKATVFPNRNMILLSIAAGYAETIGGSFVAYAAHSNDRAVYPDCRPEFVHSVAVSLWLGTGQKVQLIEPFVEMTKADIVELGLDIEAPLHKTWSCYKGEERPCGTCGTCLERAEAFWKADAEDPALTREEWDRFVGYLEMYGVSSETQVS